MLSTRPFFGAHPFPASLSAPGRGMLVIGRDRKDSRVSSRVTGVRAESPLRLLLPNNHGSAVWAFASTFGGGLVGGDAIDLDVRVEAEAALLLCTQASTKVYRSTRQATQHLAARVAEGAFLAVVPDPIQCFAGARYAQTTHIELAEGASLVLVEALVSGRVARGERWDFVRYETDTTVRRGDVTLARDRTILEPAEASGVALRERMGRFDALVTAMVFGPKVSELKASLVAAARLPSRKRASLLAAASPLHEDGAVLRIAAERVEDASTLLRTALAPLVDLLGDDPFARKY